MSLMNPVDVTGISSPFDPTLAINARNKAEAYTKSKAALRAGALGGSAASFLGKAQGQKFMDKAGAFAQQQQQNASNFGNIMNLAGGIGGFAAQGGFGGVAEMKGPSVGAFDGAWNTELNVGGFTPSEILSNPNIGYNPFG